MKNTQRAESRFRVCWGLALLTAVACIASAGANASPQASPAAGAPPTSAQLIYSVKGPELFRAYCATCHGSDAKGGGPMASVLKVQVPDLTILAKKNKGQFPAALVRNLIAGDATVASHGSRQMPVWGPIFHQIENDQDFGNVRLQNLVQYLQSIQGK